MRKILGKKFFNRDTLIVTEELLGKFLVLKRGKKIEARMITEVEAYDGLEDLASHARFGKTRRNEIMFGEAGYWYVYFIYGMYWMLNIVTGPKDHPAAILIRGVEGLKGPGKLTRNLGITNIYNHVRAEKKTNLWIEDRGITVDKKNILRTPRIGVTYAGPIWSKKKYRFLLKKISSSSND